jgi:hypothetical protein
MLIRWKCADFYLGPEATLRTLPLREAEYMTATGTLLSVRLTPCARERSIYDPPWRCDRQSKSDPPADNFPAAQRAAR